MGALRALVVDDSPTMRGILVAALSRIPHLACVQAQDGAEGLRRFGEARFDVVFTDLHMPLMDGLKLIHAIRSAGHRAVPIVMVTTASSEEDRRRALALGANVYLVKPVQARAVEETARALLGLL